MHPRIYLYHWTRMRAYRNIVEGDAGLRDLLELRLVAPKVHGATHGSHWVASLAASRSPAHQSQSGHHHLFHG